MKKFSVKTIVAIGIGAALFFVLGRFAAIPSPVPNTNISIQYGVLALFAAVYGPIAGVLIGFIGHFFIDFSYGWGVWYSWVITSAFVGGVIGFAASKMQLDEGVFGKKDIVVFNIAQAVAHLIGWGLVAPVLDIVIYAEPANKVFVQGLVGGISNIITTAIVGTLLCVAFAAAKPKKGSLEADD